MTGTAAPHETAIMMEEGTPAPGTGPGAEIETEVASETGAEMGTDPEVMITTTDHKTAPGAEREDPGGLQVQTEAAGIVVRLTTSEPDVLSKRAQTSWLLSCATSKTEMVRAREDPGQVHFKRGQTVHSHPLQQSPRKGYFIWKMK